MSSNAVGPNVGGTTFLAGCPVGVMGSTPATRADRHALLSAVVATDRRGKLASQLAGPHPDSSTEEIDEAIQAACKAFLDEPHSVDAVGEAYAWIRTAAHRILIREHERLDRLVPLDPAGEDPGISVSASAPDAATIDHAIDIERLTARLVESLSESKLEVLALYSAGYPRPEIARRLGHSERAIKRYLLEILDAARAAMVKLSGGGCPRGEPLIVRQMCGLASPAEATRAQLHLARCPRCAQLRDRLDLWREKAGALLPAPAEQADPGFLERTLHKAVDGLGSLRQHLADGGSQVKQQATATYYRAADPTPLAGARPGAVAAVVAGCLAVGTGTYTCVEQGINPFTAIPGLGQPARERDASEEPARVETVQPIPVGPDPPVEHPKAAPAPEVSGQPAEVSPSEPAPAPASGADSLSGLGGNPTPTPAPAPAPPPTSSGDGSDTTFGGL